ncbi:hypothetical protein BH20ACI3_BH20ACI3_26660 [soil metagenome]
MIDTLRYLKRNRYFPGKLLTAEDLELEQQYFREKLKRHNQYLHGFGIVFGLKVTQNAREVVISPGVAIDCQGNEIVLPEPQEQALPGPDLGATLFLSVSYIEKEADPVPAEVSNSSVMENSRIEESAAAIFGKANANQGHRHFNGRWSACGKSHGLTIARLKFSAGRWRIDRRHHAPLIK